MYTVKKLADLAGVTVRTLHYYDEIGLLKPSFIGDNGYRHYDEDDLLQLQQILFFREIDLGLNEIKTIIDDPDFDRVGALRSHRTLLQKKINRLQNLIRTVDNTISHLAGEKNMSDKQIFGGFSEEQEEQYAKEAAQEYGEEIVGQSMKLWKSYGRQKQQAIKDEGNAIYADLVAVMGKRPESQDVLDIMGRWHQHLRYFYEPTPEMLRGLGQLYNSSPDFIANFQKLHPDLPAFLEQAVNAYCDRLADSN